MSDHDHIVEPHTSTLHTRRDSCAPRCSGRLSLSPCRSFSRKPSSPLTPWRRIRRSDATGKDASILIVLQLAGGNDGINTLIPYGDDAYYRARPVIGIPKEKVLPLNDYAGLNPGLAGLKGLHDEGYLSILQGVGYPNPNRSHFRSTEIWQTASDADKLESYGWLGRYFDSCCKGRTPRSA